MKQETKNIIIKLKAKLDKEGYNTTWQDPFYSWVHNLLDKDSSQNECDQPLTLYIKNDLVLKDIPIDILTNAIVGEGETLYVAMSLYFYNALIDLYDAEEINLIYKEHDQNWFPLVQKVFGIPENDYQMTWDTEYDDCIVDALWCRLPIYENGKITSLVSALSNAMKNT